MSRRTPLARVLGLGSAKDGVGHWWAQRLSALALLVLGVWFVIALLGLSADGRLDHAAVTAWIALPWVTIALTLLLAVGAYHSELGVQVVVEDYVHHDWVKLALLIGSKFAHLALAVAGVYAVLRIGFGGAG